MQQYINGFIKTVFDWLYDTWEVPNGNVERKANDPGHICI